ncbi:uncharacterized protein LOC18445991 [Amborella trichopoda]|uniref:Uncharacterized protein n=1 Tax=Amborella trichopoda TaxID=13333 RepID=U5CWE4_AMBTC|nr:uncharacterized protein LOC18445991 [Amborella trichopoda]ERN17646.1 hypothetical protein AMTR_s00059p00180050 [Amborella trichopoda]|eukprot:XP_006856179.1 uncharacterized protein LOC18445991 [Amborella trichopoda]
MASTTESLLVEERQAEKSVDLKPIVEEFAGRLVKVMRNLNGKASRFRAQRFVERAIIDCRFFTLIGVAGSLLGSILCFLEGVFLVLESFVEYFKVVMWRRSDEGQMVLLLMEAIDMFFVGTAMLIFGMALHELFIRSKDINTENESSMSSSNLFGRFHLKGRPAWMEMGSVGDAKTKIGQAVVMVLQVGVLEKGKKVQLLSGLDMACFAGAILASAACIFILSMLSSSNRGPIRWWK